MARRSTWQCCCLCAAVVDGITFNGATVETGTDSYRLASTRARTEAPAEGPPLEEWRAIRLAGVILREHFAYAAAQPAVGVDRFEPWHLLEQVAALVGTRVRQEGSEFVGDGIANQAQPGEASADADLGRSIRIRPQLPGRPQQERSNQVAPTSARPASFEGTLGLAALRLMLRCLTRPAVHPAAARPRPVEAARAA